MVMSPEWHQQYDAARSVHARRLRLARMRADVIRQMEALNGAEQEREEAGVPS